MNNGNKIKALRLKASATQEMLAEAYEYVQRQIDFLNDEWNITEGADVDALEEEKNRLLNLLL